MKHLYFIIMIFLLGCSPKQKSVPFTGNFPDIALDKNGNLHIVYNQQGLKYRFIDLARNKWGDEENVGCQCLTVERSDPDIVIDSKGSPHVFCGKMYARKTDTNWKVLETGAERDTELAIDSNDRLYIVHRGGNNGGFMGIRTMTADGNEWIALEDPDKSSMGANNHVYPDLLINHSDNSLHLVQRHGKIMEVTYRSSSDGGKTWPVDIPVHADRQESPHITIDSKGTIFIATGKGRIMRLDNGQFVEEGIVNESLKREQPELTADKQDNIYCFSFGGKINIRKEGKWREIIQIPAPSDSTVIGFVEGAGADNGAYIIWEEGKGEADLGLKEDASIHLAKLSSDGILTRLN